MTTNRIGSTLAVTMAAALLTTAMAGASGASVTPGVYLALCVFALAAPVVWLLRQRTSATQPVGPAGAHSPARIPVEPAVRRALQTWQSSAEPGVDLRELLDAILTEPRAQARKRGLAVTSHVSRTTAKRIEGDTAGFARTVEGLVESAVRKTLRGGVHVEIDGVAATRPGYVVLQVIVTDSSSGVGEGLWLEAERWVEHHGGQLEVLRQPGVGTVASFRVEMLLAAESDSASPAHSMRRLRVLLADENLVSRKQTTQALEQAGHHADIAVNGIQALHKALHGEYDVILMDVQMPHLGAPSMASRLREVECLDRRRTPVIALSARQAQLGERTGWLSAGIDDYMVKPLDAGELHKKLIHWTKRP